MKLYFEIKDLKPISKQSGTKITRTHGYSKPEYVAFKKIVGYRAVEAMHKKNYREPSKASVKFECHVQWPFKNKSSERIGDIADNVISGIIDAMQGIVYENDKQIIYAIVKRFFSPNKAIKIWIETGIEETGL